MGRFDGKVALVTGATAGIGRATAVAFAQEGARVVVAGRRELDGLETIALVEAADGEAIFARTDVSVEDDVVALVATTLATFGRLDCAVNNAGVFPPVRPIVEQTVEDCDLALATNVRGTFLCVKHELPPMLEAGSGAIVNTASVAGLVGSVGKVPYDASKHGVVGLTRTVALEVARSGVRVNAVCPSTVGGPMDDALMAQTGISPAELADSMPIGRMCTPEEVAPAILFLCSDEASYITGATLAVDGGYTAQ